MKMKIEENLKDNKKFELKFQHPFHVFDALILHRSCIFALTTRKEMENLYHDLMCVNCLGK